MYDWHNMKHLKLRNFQKTCGGCNWNSLNFMLTEVKMNRDGIQGRNDADDLIWNFFFFLARVSHTISIDIREE